MTWWVYLKGDEFDLETLILLFSEAPYEVRRDDNGVRLTTDAITNAVAAQDAFDVAKSELTLVNAAARVVDGSFRPVELTGRISDGSNTQYMFLEDTATFRARLTITATATVNGQTTSEQIGPTAQGSDLLRRAARDAALAEALGYLSGPTVGYGELWKAYEVLEHAAGGDKALAERVGVPMRQLNAFGATNHPEASGPTGRHARAKGSKPKEFLTLQESRALVNRMIEAWTPSATT